jgi:tetratricopeptide (TPR) repeat protein
MVAEAVGSHEIARIVGEVESAMRAQDPERALELANAAILRGMEHPALFNVRGIGLAQQGRHEEALADFRHNLTRFPRYPGSRLAVGQCCVQLGRWNEALAAFDAVVAAAPKFPLAHERRGLALSMLFERDASRRAYERAVELKPDFADALASLSMIAALEKDGVTARSVARGALAADPKHATAIVSLAMLDIEDGDISAAEKKLETILDVFPSSDDLRAIAALGVLADAFARLERTEAAFSAYAAINDKIQKIYAPRYEAARMAEKVARLTTYFERSACWSAGRQYPAEPGDAAGHVFLLGYARSGTTLLEAVLASNDKVAALDERNCLRDADRAFLESDLDLDRLAALSDNDIEHWRNTYWNAVRREGIRFDGKVFLDKMPSYTINLPLIAKLFPAAKVLFALRDPRDVVLSCFRHRFVMNRYTFEFLSLENCARQYAATMKLAELYREALPLDLRLHRYEVMILDFDSSIEAVCSFVGIEWDRSMRDFNEGTRVVKEHGQSVRQLRQGLYSGAEGQWRSYGKQLAPILPILAPWIERFGYLAD